MEITIRITETGLQSSSAVVVPRLILSTMTMDYDKS